jgi:hypothetical protein
LKANLEAASAAMEAAASEPFVEGSMGQLKPHPGFVVAARCGSQAGVATSDVGAFGPTAGLGGFGELDALEELRGEPCGAYGRA